MSKERRKRLHNEIFTIIHTAKDVPCARCGENFPSVCMDFDHLPEFDKLFNIGSPSNWTSVGRVMAEIAKCQVICSNCHRIVTWERKNGRECPVPERMQEKPKKFWCRFLTELLGCGKV